LNTWLLRVAQAEVMETLMAVAVVLVVCCMAHSQVQQEALL
jgi:hypothetical protein